MNEAFVYRLYSRNGRLLYIGSTSNLDNRLKAHKSNPYFGSRLGIVRVEKCSDIKSARKAEARAIWREQPPHNKLHKLFVIRDYQDLFGFDISGDWDHEEGSRLKSEWVAKNRRAGRDVSQRYAFVSLQRNSNHAA